jgi:hypothetical protein
VFPYIWETFEVCRVHQTLPWHASAASSRVSKRKAMDPSSNPDSSEIVASEKKKLATELIWMIELIMIRDPSQAEKIQYVEFSLIHYREPLCLQ